MEPERFECVLVDGVFWCFGLSDGEVIGSGNGEWRERERGI